LIAIQNGVRPQRLVSLNLDKAGGRVAGFEVLEAANPDHAEPTLGVIVGGSLVFNARSQWEHFPDDGTVRAADKLREPLIARLQLP
jgi:hypothetical protein